VDVLLEHVITPFGLPHEFLTDRGSNFLSGGLTKFLKASEIDKSNTSGYHPRTNGKNEQHNGILETTLFKLNATAICHVGRSFCSLLFTQPASIAVIVVSSLRLS
jgi:transposase InsO family protein